MDRGPKLKTSPNYQAFGRPELIVLSFTVFKIDSGFGFGVKSLGFLPDLRD